MNAPEAGALSRGLASGVLGPAASIPGVPEAPGDFAAQAPTSPGQAPADRSSSEYADWYAKQNKYISDLAKYNDAVAARGNEVASYNAALGQYQGQYAPLAAEGLAGISALQTPSGQRAGLAQLFGAAEPGYTPGAAALDQLVLASSPEARSNISGLYGKYGPGLEAVSAGAPLGPGPQAIGFPDVPASPAPKPVPEATVPVADKIRATPGQPQGVPITYGDAKNAYKPEDIPDWMYPTGPVRLGGEDLNPRPGLHRGGLISSLRSE